MPRLYQICVGHVLDETWNEWFDGLTLTTSKDSSTILMGILDDPAALHTVLNKIRDLNLDLVSVSYTDIPESQNETK
jgi:hypothetical protein